MYIAILFKLKKDGDSSICDNMGQTGVYYAKWYNPVTKRQILSDSTYMRYLK